MATRLSLYSGALRTLGERALASLSEEREPRRLLDDAWDNGAVDYVLSTAQWRFASRAVELVPEDDIETSFGFVNAFQRPIDHVRTTGLCADEFFNCPLEEYSYEAGYYYADVNPIFLRYVSNHADFGGNLADWPAAFTIYAQLYLASQIIGSLTSAKIEPAALDKMLRKARTEAASTDAMESPTTRPPAGTWVRSRYGSGVRWDRGSRSRLIG